MVLFRIPLPHLDQPQGQLSHHRLFDARVFQLMAEQQVRPLWKSLLILSLHHQKVLEKLPVGRRCNFRRRQKLDDRRQGLEQHSTAGHQFVPLV